MWTTAGLAAPPCCFLSTNPPLLSRTNKFFGLGGDWKQSAVNMIISPFSIRCVSISYSIRDQPSPLAIIGYYQILAVTFHGSVRTHPVDQPCATQIQLMTYQATSRRVIKHHQLILADPVLNKLNESPPMVTLIVAYQHGFTMVHHCPSSTAIETTQTLP